MNGNRDTHFIVYSGQKEGKKFMCYLDILFLMDLYTMILHRVELEFLQKFEFFGDGS